MKTREQEECIVSAESAVEAGACFDTTLGTTVEECISDAESIDEINDCKA